MATMSAQDRHAVSNPRGKSVQIRWKASFSASCLHAAASMFEGLPIADRRIAEILQPATEALVNELGECGFDARSTLPALVGLAADYENNRQLAEMAVNRVVGGGTINDAAVSRLAGCIADLEAAWLREQPELVDELAVRSRPLREQWEARGPGLLRAIERLVPPGFIAPQAELVLVSPVVGGHGRVHLFNNRLTIEAVLTNPNEDVPEILRIGWLLSQLNLDVPMFSEPISRVRLPQLASFATLPLVLAAADSVDLATLDEATLVRVLECWHLSLPSSDVAQKLLDWWQVCENSTTRWPVALSALDQMLGD